MTVVMFDGRPPNGARMIVESGSPVLVVKTVVSVLEARPRAAARTA